LDRFEYLCALVLADLRSEKDGWICGWWGRWVYRGRRYGVHISERLREERQRQQIQWPPITSGMFGSLNRFDEILELQRNECLNQFVVW
jgi:hypothetical protein